MSVIERWDHRSGSGDTLRGPISFCSSGRLALLRCLLFVVTVKTVLVDVVDNLVRNVVANALTPLTEKADLG